MKKAQIRKPYLFLEHTADIRFEAYGKDVNELFVNAGMALSASMVNVNQIKPGIEREVKFRNKDVEYLLHDFLSEIVFFKDAEQLVFSKYAVEVKQEKRQYVLTATASGEKINPKRHELHDDPKAITWHQFRVKKEKEGWKAHVIVDI